MGGPVGLRDPPGKDDGTERRHEGEDSTKAAARARITVSAMGVNSLPRPR